MKRGAIQFLKDYNFFKEGTFLDFDKGFYSDKDGKLYTKEYIESLNKESLFGKIYKNSDLDRVYRHIELVDLGSVCGYSINEIPTLLRKDGEVFEVGDFTNFGTIIQIKEDKEKIIITTQYAEISNTEFLIKIDEPYLFTKDYKSVDKDSIVWIVEDFEIVGSKKASEFKEGEPDCSAFIFSKESNANNFIEENRTQYSKSDIRKVFLKFKSDENKNITDYLETEITICAL